MVQQGIFGWSNDGEITKSECQMGVMKVACKMEVWKVEYKMGVVIFHVW